LDSDTSPLFQALQVLERSLKQPSTQATWREVFPELATWLTPERLDALEHQAGWKLLGSAPRTWSISIENMIRDFSFPDLDSMPEEQAAKCVIDFCRLFENFVQPATEGLVAIHLESLSRPVGKNLYILASHCRREFDPEGTRICDAVTRIDGPAFFGSGNALKLLHLDREPLFEEWVDAFVGQTHQFAEVFYRQGLHAVLSLTKLLLGQPIEQTPAELGGLMAECKRVFRGDPVFDGLLLDEIRIIRNARAHSQIELDVQNKTVTFINRRRDGREERLGPWTREQFGECFSRFAQLCRDMLAAFRLSGPSFLDDFKKMTELVTKLREMRLEIEASVSDKRI